MVVVVVGGVPVVLHPPSQCLLTRTEVFRVYAALYSLLNTFNPLIFHPSPGVGMKRGIFSISQMRRLRLKAVGYLLKITQKGVVCESIAQSPLPLGPGGATV